MRLTKSVAISAAAGLFFAVLSVSDLQAQSETLKATIPFDFKVADKQLPAGTYTVRQSAGGAIRISDGEGHSATVLSNPVRKGSRAIERDSLIFTKYGDAYFLSEARWTGYKDARSVIKSRAEVELAKGLSPNRVNMAAAVR